MSDVMDLKLHLEDVLTLVEILSWADSTAQQLSALESNNGNITNANKMNEYSIFIKDFLELINKDITIGQPDSDILN